MTFGLILLTFWGWELFEHFLLPQHQIFFFIETVSLTFLLFIVLTFLFRAISDLFQQVKKSNKDLVAVKNYQTSLLDSSLNAIIAVNPKGLIASFNRQAESLSGFETKNAIGMDALRLFQDANRIRQALDASQSQDKVETVDNTPLITKHGEEIPVSVSIRRFKYWDDMSGGFVFFVEDLREKKRLERRLIISEKMAAVSQLAAGLSHELRNPLASIVVNMRNLEDQIRKGDGQCENCEKYLTMISSEVESLNRLVGNFIRIAVPQKVDLGSCICDLQEILNAALKQCKQLLRTTSTQIAAQSQKHSLCVKCHREQLIQAFSNIIQNAVEAMSVSGKLTIEIEQDGDCSLVKICDTGGGIPGDNVERIFDFYFTTKASGFGIGLPFASLIIEQHGGRIEVESEVNKGTRVFVRLPVIKAHSNAKRRENKK